VSLGKNRDTPDADAVRDYVAGMEALGPLADFVVVNVSSPNTAGLREWQELSRLENLLRSVVSARMRLGLQHSTPLLVKLSPDLEHDQLADIGKLCLRLGIDGIVMSNTTTLSSAGDYVRWKLDHPQGSELGGGLSGAPLLEKSTEGIRVLFRATQGRIPIVGVGGIMTARDCVQKLKAGASLVQIYSGMVYQGPGMVSRLRRDLAQAVLDEGVRSAEELVGMDHEDLYWARQQEKVAVQRRFHSRVVAVAGTAGAGGASVVPAAASAAAAAGLVAGVPPVGAGAVAAAAVPTTKGFPGPGAGSPAAPPSAAPVGTMAQAGSAPAAASGALPAVPPQQQATQPRPKNYRHL
jgi:dihydroorotate dehydrogenase